MKKALSLVVIAALLLMTSMTAFAADAGTVYQWTFTNLSENSDFEGTAAAAGSPIALPTYDHETVVDQDLSATAGWFSNPADIGATIESGVGFGGGKALKIAGDGGKAFGAAYWKLPAGAFADKDVIAVSFLYKVSDTMKAGTPQIHAHITPNTVWAAGDPIAVIKDDPGKDVIPPADKPERKLTASDCGFTDYVGTPAGDGWYRVTGTVACEAFGDRTFLRLFADFRQPEGTPTLGSDAYVLFDDIQIGKAVPAANPAADENLSSANLVAGGDFEDKTLGEKLGTTYDDDGWGSNAWDADSTAFVRDGSSKVLRLAGNNAVAYGTALYKMPELTAERTYRLAFDYKFIDVTDTLSWQAHVSLLNNKQAGTPGGWYTINLLTLPGVELENGYRHVEMDFTPSEFEASAISDLRFFIQIGADNGNDTGIYFDNVALYDIANADPLPDEVQEVIDMVDGFKAMDELSEADKADVKAAYDAYNALSAEHKAMVPEHIVTFLNRAYDKLFDEPGSSVPSNPSTPSETPDGPKTGVASAVPFVLLLGAASAAAVAVSRRREK